MRTKAQKAADSLVLRAGGKIDYSARHSAPVQSSPVKPSAAGRADVRKVLAMDHNHGPRSALAEDLASDPTLHTAFSGWSR